MFTLYLVNLSDTMLLDLYLAPTALPSPLLAVTIIRERGALTYENPTEKLVLGNLHPEESLECRLAFTDTETDFCLETVKNSLFYQREDESPITNQEILLSII